jgi:hypothetical protein
MNKILPVPILPLVFLSGSVTGTRNIELSPPNYISQLLESEGL